MIRQKRVQSCRSVNALRAWFTKNTVARAKSIAHAHILLAPLVCMIHQINAGQCCVWTDDRYQWHEGCKLNLKNALGQSSYQKAHDKWLWIRSLVCNQVSICCPVCGRCFLRKVNASLSKVLNNDAKKTKLQSVSASVNHILHCIIYLPHLRPIFIQPNTPKVVFPCANCKSGSETAAKEMYIRFLFKLSVEKTLFARLNIFSITCRLVLSMGHFFFLSCNLLWRRKEVRQSATAALSL